MQEKMLDMDLPGYVVQLIRWAALLLFLIVIAGT